MKNNNNNNDLEKIDIEMSEEEFARFYFEQTGEGSNVYFAQAKGLANPKFAVYYRILPGRVKYKKDLIGSSIWKFALAGVGIFAIFAIIFSSLNIFNFDQSLPETETSRLPIVAYNKLLDAQDKFLKYHFLDSMFAFHDAYLSFTPSQKPKEKLVSSLFAMVGGYLGLNNGKDVPVEDKNSEKSLRYSGRQIAVSLEPIFKISLQSVFASELSDPEKSVGRAFSESSQKIKQALEALGSAEQQLSSVHNSNESMALRQKLPLISLNLKNLAAKFDLASWMLGADGSKKILVVFQNSNYPRPTGGAAVSYGLLESEGGYLKKISFDDARNLDGQLAVKVIPPIPLQKTATFWNFQNANWFLDFPTSASKLVYFYEKATGVKVDGVVALNDAIVKNMLNEIGSFDVLRLGATVSVNDFDAILAESMQNTANANKSKRILNDLLGAIFEKIPSLSGEKIVNLFSLVKTGLDGNDILAWFNNEDYQKQISGFYHKNDQPVAALSRIDTEKEDRLKYSFSTKKEIGFNGGQINETSVTINYEQGGIGQATTTKLQVESVYLRIYVPLGATLINASGDIYKENYPYFDYGDQEFQSDADVRKMSETLKFDSLNATEIYEESEKTVFGAWVRLTSEKPAKAVFKYKLP